MMLGLVTITRNSASTLHSTLQSLEGIAGSVGSVFIDAASTDGTREVLDLYCDSHEFAWAYEQRSAGLYEALNEGIERLMGCADISHIGVLHSDDILIQPQFRDYADAMLTSGKDLGYSDIAFHNDSGARVRTWKAHAFSLRKLRTGWMPPHTSVIASRELYQEVGLYDSNFGTAADYEWVVRALKSGNRKLFYYPHSTVSMRVGGASGSSIRARLAANRMDGMVWRDEHFLQTLLIRILKPSRKLFQFRIDIGTK